MSIRALNWSLLQNLDINEYKTLIFLADISDCFGRGSISLEYLGGQTHLGQEEIKLCLKKLMDNKLLVIEKSEFILLINF